ncbi:ribonuclease M5 [Granulicatella sp. zg-ZJ]|uniref:ribonuclease M5 n=1 Tax=Granulicatella sp. zg-ZJ TaxID=2678504 RepID=UPI0013D72086|nr:ribonuclease M5 [Granulicatella sp. zg-ZJ]MBS4749905.1 ribonuclease M5 [Carnobacteriaceae bacterium zg-ZUI78]NEW62097.1 ribonuclease M5 [Granulicatella sp. zg-ZJ]
MKEIIVVEGRDDTRRLTEVFGKIDTIETNGSAIDEETLLLIEKAHQLRGVIVLTDPDFPGEKIRKIITQRVPNVKHAFLHVQEALPKGKGSLGVEHASEMALKRALHDVKVIVDDFSHDNITKSFLMRCSLIGSEQSAYLRQALSKQLGIGHVNGKQLEKRLNMFGISKEDVLNVLTKIVEEENIKNG